VASLKQLTSYWNQGFTVAQSILPPVCLVACKLWRVLHHTSCTRNWIKPNRRKWTESNPLVTWI